MSMDEKLGYVSITITEQMLSFDRKRKANRRKAVALKLAVTALGGIVTVLLGIKDTGNEIVLRNVALIVSALLTLLSTWDAFFNHRDLWVRYTLTYTEIASIRSDFDYLTIGGAPPSEEKIDALYARLQEVLRNTNDWWWHERIEGRVVKPG